MIFITKESYKRVEVKRWHQRILSRYLPPKFIKLTILLPCSARKPYSKSKSHRRYKTIIRKAAGDKYTLVHEVIITSPLGIVPRELEKFYPATEYDIVTTGHWIEEEKILIKTLVKDYIKKANTKVIAYLKENYKDIFRNIDIEFISISDKNSENHLMDRIRECLKNHKPIPKEIREDENIRSMIRFQFGENILRYFNKNTFKIIKNEIYYNNECIGRLNNKGFIIFNENSLKYINDYNEYYVLLKKIPKSKDIHAKDIIDVDEKIREGDCVFLKLGDKTIGIGIAKISSYSIKKCKNSVAVKTKYLIS